MPIRVCCPAGLFGQRRSAHTRRYPWAVRLEKMFRNVIIEATAKGGLEPRECTFDFNDDGGCRIIHAPSGSSFVLEGDFSRWKTTAVVGDSPSWQVDAYTFPTVGERAERWARDVKRDVETPDLWAELQRQREVLTGVLVVDDDVGDTPFSADEQAEIAEQLRQIKALVAEKYPRSEAQMQILEARFDDLEAAAGRMGRQDWLLRFLGVMFTVIVTDLLTPEAVQDILAMALHGLGHLYGGGTGPLLPPPR
jgi:hypothetical protein